MEKQAPYNLDKEYVDFYYFWQWQYIYRNAIRVFESRYGNPEEAVYKIELDNVAGYILNGVFMTYFPDILIEVMKSKSIPTLLFDGDPVRLIVNENINAYTLSGNYLLDVILKYKSACAYLENICLPPISRDFSELGISIIGQREVSVKEDGKLTGTLIIELDLSLPTSILQKEIEHIKQLNFFSPVSYKEIHEAVHKAEINYAREREAISIRLNRKFRTRDDHARAIGLWFYDKLHWLNDYDCFDDAYSALKNSRFDDEEHGGTPGILELLGYANSEISTIKRLYRGTLRCVEACEVLQLSDRR